MIAVANPSASAAAESKHVSMGGVDGSAERAGNAGHIATRIVPRRGFFVAQARSLSASGCMFTGVLATARQTDPGALGAYPDACGSDSRRIVVLGRRSKSH